MSGRGVEAARGSVVFYLFFENWPWATVVGTAIHAALIVGFGLRIILVRRPPGVSLAWLLLLITLPYVGAGLYWLIGERPLGRRRQRRARDLHGALRRWLHSLGRQVAPPVVIDSRWNEVRRLADGVVGVPVLPDNDITLHDDSESILKAIAADIAAAKRTCDLEFYIWNPGGLADEVAAALIAAAERGVRCRVLLDAVGSAALARSDWPRQFRAAGIALRFALPVGLLRMVFARIDLRLHRKLALIDGRVAHTGSMNLVDPRFFKQGTGVGQWVDCMVRVEGPAVQTMATLFEIDWELESPEGTAGAPDFPRLDGCEPRGTSPVQLAPSGPGYEDGSILKLVIEAVSLAQREIVLTTPYFVPDEALVLALCAAAQRGVHVVLLLPARIDSRLVRLACGAYFGDLMRAGVEIRRFEAGLLHTKSITLDGEAAFVGTVNLDMRSMRLNFEMTLLVYDPAFTQKLRALQETYCQRSRAIELTAWDARPLRQRVAENAANLLSPLL